jgi:hypothetical protein
LIVTDSEWTSSPSCCTEPRFERDERFMPKYGPVSERVVRCAQCGAMWIEEWSSLAGYDGREDRDFVRYLLATEEKARATFALSET